MSWFSWLIWAQCFHGDGADQLIRTMDRGGGELCCHLWPKASTVWEDGDFQNEDWFYPPSQHSTDHQINRFTFSKSSFCLIFFVCKVSTVSTLSMNLRFCFLLTKTKKAIFLLFVVGLVTLLHFLRSHDRKWLRGRQKVKMVKAEVCISWKRLAEVRKC